MQSVSIRRGSRFSTFIFTDTHTVPGRHVYKHETKMTVRRGVRCPVKICKIIIVAQVCWWSCTYRTYRTFTNEDLLLMWVDTHDTKTRWLKNIAEVWGKYQLHFLVSRTEQNNFLMPALCVQEHFQRKHFTSSPIHLPSVVSMTNSPKWEASQNSGWLRSAYDRGGCRSLWETFSSSLI